MMPLLRVDRRRATGDKRLVLTATVLPVLFILALGLLAGSPKEPIGLVHPSARLLQLAHRSGDLSLRVEASRSSLVDDILRGRVVAGLVELPSSPGTIRVDFVAQSAQTDAVQARTDVVALLDLMAAEGGHTHLTDTALAHARIPPAMSPFSYVAPSDLVLFMGITLLVLSAGQVESRRLGMLRRLAAAPVRQRAIVAAQIVGRLMIAAGQAVGLLFLGRVIFGVHWGNPFAIVLIVGFLALSLAGASVLIGSWARTQEQAIATSVVVGIAAGMLGGCMYPLDVVGNTVRMVGHAVPQAWAMDALIKLIYHQASLTSVLPQIGVLAGFGVVLSALALRAYARTMYSPG
jgi:linearmycin/streptolysin S transport system permease protein